MGHVNLPAKPLVKGNSEVLNCRRTQLQRLFPELAS